MLIPNREFDVDFDDPDIVLPWWAILSAAAWALLGLALLLPFLPLAFVFSRPKGLDEFVDPIEAALAATRTREAGTS